MHPRIALLGLLFATPCLAQEAPFQITEFLAVNAHGLTDFEKDLLDWIEIRNTTDVAQNLSGWHLSDDPDDLTKWKAPSWTIPAGSYQVIFASGKDKSSIFQEEVHTNFTLSRSAGYLALADAEGGLVQEFRYPTQRPDIAYGLDQAGEEAFFRSSAGKDNEFVLLDKVADTKFSVDRGFATEAFETEITSTTEGAQIIYTTDGEAPGEGTIFTGTIGEVYQDPILIDKTTTLRAIAVKKGHVSSNIDTHTYIFPEQVIRQPNDPEGFPDKWVTYPADYGMDPRVVDDPAYKDEIVDALKSLPTMSIVLGTDDLFSAKDGIYARSEDRGDESEREASVELIHSDGTQGFQENCGVRIHGFGWRPHTNTHKHSFRLEFRERYGKTKLDYKLFPDAPVERFDSIVLRSQGSKGWQDFRDPEQSQYLHDTFARDTARDMGKIDGHATYVHLYLNGLYWGLYNPVERPDGDFAAEYFGGEPEDYDAVNRRTSTNEAIDGDLVAYNRMIALAQKGVRTLDDYEAVQEYLDIDDMIDYMLIHQYTSNRDGPEEFNSNNMRGLRKREEGAQFRFFVWDMEYSLWNVDRNININVAIPGSISFVYSRLRNFPEFRLRYADHIHKHLSNGGALTPGPVLERWNRRSDEIFSALIGESARWGDAKRPAEPFTRDIEWAEERRRLVEEYFPDRTNVLLRQLRAADLYPSVQAPDYNQHGGRVDSGFQLTMTAGDLFKPQGGQFLYTTDGSDPRVYGTGEVSSTAQTYDRSGPGISLTESMTIRSRTFDEGEWSALNSATFIVGRSPTAETLKITEIHYRPAAPNDAERAAGFDSRSDFEFLELFNASTEPIDLTGLAFTRGLTLSFDQLGVLDLASNATGLLVRKRAAFEMRYGEGLPVLGEFTQGRLANDGETLTLSLDGGAIIQEIAYDDEDPWPVAADGEGFSLTLIDSTADAAAPSSWRASAAVDGTPGQFHTGDSPIVGETDPQVTVTREVLEVDGQPSLYWIIGLIGLEADHELEVADDLETWRTEATGFVSLGPERWRSQLPVSDDTDKRVFVRFRYVR